MRGKCWLPQARAPQSQYQRCKKITTTLLRSGILMADHPFTIDTGAMQSIIRLDVVKGKCEALRNVRLRTATGESATVHGKTEVKVTIANNIDNR